jgi:hypothetical protein
VSDEDKHCYACKDADDECVTPCHWTQRCFSKAKHANATSLSYEFDSIFIVSNEMFDYFYHVKSLIGNVQQNDGHVTYLSMVVYLI